jgi:hypothetical protein
MNALASRLSSPRVQRRLFWVGGIVLVCGVVAVIVTTVWTGPGKEVIPPPLGKLQVPQKEKTVAIDPAAQKVGEEFIRSAVLRKNLDASYPLVAPVLRQNFTLKQWESGNIPVVPYPADLSGPSRVKIEYSYKDSVLFLILLQPKRGDTTKPQLFHLGLHAFGTGAKRHWLVDYWAPYGVPKIPLG